MEKRGDVMLGVEDESGQPISALSILSLLERVSTIIDGVQASQQRMEERQQQLESSVSAVQSELVKLARDHGATATTVDKLLQKARRVSTHVKEVRSRVEKQNMRVKKVETTQDELLTRNKFRVVIYQVNPLLTTAACLLRCGHISEILVKFHRQKKVIVNNVALLEAQLTQKSLSNKAANNLNTLLNLSPSHKIPDCVDS